MTTIETNLDLPDERIAFRERVEDARSAQERKTLIHCEYDTVIQSLRTLGVDACENQYRTLQNVLWQYGYSTMSTQLARHYKRSVTSADGSYSNK